MKGQFLTDQGRVRSHNEDAGGIFYNRAGQLLAIIADGMGGHQAGDVASQMAIYLMEEKWEQQSELHSPEEAEKFLSTVVSQMNHSIYSYGLEKPECEGMGTTVVITICTHEFVTIAHIGDSRCYMLGDSRFTQLTEDHSLVNELVRSGQISKDAAEQHPRKNVLLKALGTEEHITSDLESVSWEQGNKLLLCSDGLTNKLSDEELKELLSSEMELREIGENMIELANDRGGEDNISLILIHYDDSSKVGEDQC
ncbi:Stp1/IreP family PP2C-type Ser/Thr phosphatase [Virgibacillus kimchii]